MSQIIRLTFFVIILSGCFCFAETPGSIEGYIFTSEGDETISGANATVAEQLTEEVTVKTIHTRADGLGESTGIPLVLDQSLIGSPSKLNKIADNIARSTLLDLPKRPDTPHFYLSESTPQEATHRSWLKRHSTLVCTAIGFGLGFVIGHSLGEGDDLTANSKGLMYGGIFAGAGAIIGTIASHTK